MKILSEESVPCKASLFLEWWFCLRLIMYPVTNNFILLQKNAKCLFSCCFCWVCCQESCLRYFNQVCSVISVPQPSLDTTCGCLPLSTAKKPQPEHAGQSFLLATWTKQTKEPPSVGETCCKETGNWQMCKVLDFRKLVDTAWDSPFRGLLALCVGKT